MRKPRLRASLATFAPLFIALTGCWRDAPSTPKPQASTPPPVQPTTSSTPSPPTEVVVHNASELATIDLTNTRALDLALSPTDRIGFIDESDTTDHDPCEGLDLLRVATRAPRLTHLRISGCQAAIHAGLASFERITTLELADNTLDGVTIGRIAQLAQLVELRLIRMGEGDDRLAPLAKLRLQRLVLADLKRDSEISLMLDLWPRTLTDVTLSGSWAGHKAMLTLSKAKALESIALLNTRVGNYSLNQIKPLERLREVTFVGSTFNDNSPLYFRELPVESFTCDCPRLGDGGLRSLRHSQGIKHLALPQSRITGEGLDALASLTKLEAFILEGHDISGDGLEALATHRSLRRLELSGTLTHLPRLENLETLETLEILRLRYDNLDDRVASQLEPLVNLHTLDLAHTQISDQGLAPLRDMTRLRVLKLHHTRVTNRGLAYLSKLPALEVLELDHTDVVDEGVAALAGLSTLEELRLDGTLVTDAGIQHLKGLSNLKRLNLSHTVITERGVATLRGLPSLEVLGLRHTRARE